MFGKIMHFNSITFAVAAALFTHATVAAVAPYPPSQNIKSLTWDTNIVRLRPGAGDNWPMTWVSDDLQITAWGDGEGFQAGKPRLSLGFARLLGNPPEVRGEDLATDADTLEGGGKRAIKASGLLSVGGVLYLWVRNYKPPGSDDFTNARLGWSFNRGTNWTWADWRFADTFGCPEFVQFGPDYLGARDGFVYVVSQANDSAYGYSPDIVLARVPKEKVPQRERYEFFAGLDARGQPAWSRELAQRKPIFTDPNGTQRVALTYNSGLRRYLLTTSHRPPGSQATHTAALGVFDAPEPWGSWTTVYYSDEWSGTNRTYHHKFPTKWMRPDGREAWLVFSGLDGGLYTLCAHKVTFKVGEELPARTRLSLKDGQWHINDQVTCPGSRAAGRLMNVRMVNAVFEDRGKPDFDPEANTDRFLANIPDYAAHGVRAFTLCLQGGMPGYEGAVNSAFNPDGSLRESYLRRVQRVIEACDRNGVAVILGCYYQRQSKILQDEAAIRTGVVNVVKWIQAAGFRNVAVEIANEYPHSGFAHPILKSPAGMAGLIRLAKRTWPELLVSASGYGDGKLHDPVAEASDFLLIHFNGTPVQQIPARIEALKQFGKPIVCNEDDKTGEVAAQAADACVANGASWGLMLNKVNQYVPFTFRGASDDPVVYAKLKELTTPPLNTESPSRDYFPPPESQGGWRVLDQPDDIRRRGGMDPDKLADLKQWLLNSDQRNFAAVVIRHGYLVLQVERGNSAINDARRVASVSKAVCATVLAIASERSQQGVTPKRMTFNDPAFQFIPWAQPLSDPRKTNIIVKQLLNHTSGVCPEATGAPNDGLWEYILGHTGDPRTARLAFDPGTACGYSTHALAHATLVCETVTGKPYDTFAIEALFRPLGIEHWWFQFYDGGEKYGRHPSHGLGMPARDLARIAYCMARDGRWGDAQVIPKWFVAETAAPTHNVQGLEMRFKLNARTFSHGWELPARLTGEGGRSGKGIPADARFKPGSGGQLIGFVPSLDLVITRQTGSSGEWQFEEYMRRACAAVVAEEPATR